jgi:hypothetical protein
MLLLEKASTFFRYALYGGRKNAIFKLNLSGGIEKFVITTSAVPVNTFHENG